MAFLDSILQEKHERKHKRTPIAKEEQQFFKFQPSKKEFIIRILTRTLPFSYFFVGKRGTVEIRDENLAIEQSLRVNLRITVPENVQGSQKQKIKRGYTVQITDAVYMGDCLHYALSTTSRNILFVDCSASVHWESFRLTNIPSIPTCLEYWQNKEGDKDESILLFGDHQGNIYILNFLQNRISLFRRQDIHGSQHVQFTDLQDHDEFVTFRIIKNSHSDLVRKIQFVPSGRGFFSCSRLDRRRPLVFHELEGDKKFSVYRLPQGIECFDCNEDLMLIVTGSKDFIVRIWNPDTKEVMHSFKGHLAPIVDVKLCGKRDLVLSLCNEGELRVWIVTGKVFLQKININFPSPVYSVKPTVYGAYSLHLHSPGGDTCLAVGSAYAIRFRFQDLEVGDMTSETRKEKAYKEFKTKSEDQSEEEPESCDSPGVRAFSDEGQGTPTSSVTVEDILHARTIYFESPPLINNKEPIAEDFIESFNGKPKDSPEMMDKGNNSSKSMDVCKQQEQWYVACDHSADNKSQKIVDFRRLMDSKCIEAPMNIRLERRKKFSKPKMKEFVLNGSPFSALQAFDLGDIRFPIDKWPLSTRMKKSGLKCCRIEELSHLDLSFLKVQDDDVKPNEH